MTALNELRQESTLAKSLIERLDRLSVRCMSSGDGLKKATRLLSLANFYGLIAEHQRAGRVLEYLSRDTSVGGARISVGSPRRGDRITKGSSPWDRDQYRLSLAKAAGLLETGEPDLALEELLEHASTWKEANPEERSEFVSVMWLALATKVWDEKLKKVVPKWDLLGGKLGEQVHKMIPVQLEHAWSYKAKAWHCFAMSEFADCREMLDGILIPELEKHARMSKEWPDLWVKSFGVLALVQAKWGNEPLALDALSKAAKIANTSHDAPSREFELLVRMEAMAMLSKSEEALAAETAFLGLGQEADKEELAKPKKLGFTLGRKHSCGPWLLSRGAVSGTR